MTMREVEAAIEQSCTIADQAYNSFTQALDTIEAAEEAFTRATVDSPAPEREAALAKFALARSAITEVWKSTPQFRPAAEAYLASFALRTTTTDDSSEQVTSSPIQPQKTPEAKTDPDQMVAWGRSVREAINAGQAPRTMAGYVDQGSSSYVFKRDGVIVKVENTETDLWQNNAAKEELETFQPGEEVPVFKTVQATRDDTVRALKRGQGIKGTEQLIPHDESNDIILTKEAPGTNLYKMTNDEQANIPERHYHELITTLEQLHARGLTIDTNPDNIFYDKDHGFTIIDYHTIAFWAQNEIVYNGPSSIEKVAPQANAVDLAGGVHTVDPGHEAPAYVQPFTDVVEQRFGTEAVDQIHQNWQEE